VAGGADVDGGAAAEADADAGGPPKYCGRMDTGCMPDDVA